MPRMEEDTFQKTLLLHKWKTEEGPERRTTAFPVGGRVTRVPRARRLGLRLNNGLDPQQGEALAEGPKSMTRKTCMYPDRDNRGEGNQRSEEPHVTLPAYTAAHPQFVRD